MDKWSDTLSPGRETSHTPKVDLRCLRDRLLLVIEARVDQQYQLGTVLQQAGADVRFAFDAHAAIQSACLATQQGCPFDAVILPMTIEPFDGYAAVRVLRARGFKGLILGMVHGDVYAQRQACLDAGCSQIISGDEPAQAWLEQLASLWQSQQIITPPPAASLTLTDDEREDSVSPDSTEHADQTVEPLAAMERTMQVVSQIAEAESAKLRSQDIALLKAMIDRLGQTNTATPPSGDDGPDKVVQLFQALAASSNDMAQLQQQVESLVRLCDNQDVKADDVQNV